MFIVFFWFSLDCMFYIVRVMALYEVRMTADGISKMSMWVVNIWFLVVFWWLL